MPICLSGIATAPGYDGALVKQTGKPGLLSVRPGDVIDDWKVAEIGAQYIVVSRGEQHIRLDLVEPADGPQPVALSRPVHPAGVKQGTMIHARSLARGERD